MALLPNSRRNTFWRRELEAAGYSWDPEAYIIGKMNECILALQDYRAFGEALPHAGGTRDQPVGWLRAMRCILRAEAEAEQEKRAEESRASAGVANDGVGLMG